MNHPGSFWAAGSPYTALPGTRTQHFLWVHPFLFRRLRGLARVSFALKAQCLVLPWRATLGFLSGVMRTKRICGEEGAPQFYSVI